jgi:hypothetical protein
MIDAMIQQFLIGNPGGSIRQITTGTGILAPTIWQVLITRLGRIWRKCRLVPRALSEV